MSRSSAGAPRPLSRRTFLHVVAASASASGLLSMPGCAGLDDEAPVIYPQGIASGDPSSSSIILWTRVEPETGGAETVEYEMATDEAFASVVASGTVSADATADHTVRIKVTELDAYTTYYYRFRARGVFSPIGRTKTAPTADADVDVRFASTTCQDFNGRYYHAWRQLVDAEDPVDFVLFLGDYIYETMGDPIFQTPTEDRSISLPDGMALDEEDASQRAAMTLADYRALYKQFRSDADLQEAHRLFPFVMIWDDHEFTNDAWQAHATYFGEAQGDENDVDRRQAATRAWFEFQPADVVYDQDAGFPNDITIYRSLRYGKHLELFLTDQRYYRDDHVIPEGPVDPDVAKIFPNSSLGARHFVLKSGFDPKELAASPTMLGETQKSWLVDGMKSSDASWKFWGSETQLSQMLIDLSGIEDLPEDYKDKFYFSLDQWDGYRSERASILTELSAVENVVVLAGDVHAFFASELHVDFDAPGDPVAVEFVTAGISSNPVQLETKNTVANNETLTSLGLGAVVPKFDTILKEACPYYKYSNSLGNGFTVIEVKGSTEVRASMVSIPDVTDPNFDGQVERTELRCAAGSNRIELV